MRGLKSFGLHLKVSFIQVAPHAGAWIEILWLASGGFYTEVAPHAGAWIEMLLCQGISLDIINVAPHAGAWIEIPR